jgi:hypothetical protein
MSTLTPNSQLCQFHFPGIGALLTHGDENEKRSLPYQCSLSPPLVSSKELSLQSIPFPEESLVHDEYKEDDDD